MQNAKKPISDDLTYEGSIETNTDQLTQISGFKPKAEVSEEELKRMLDKYQCEPFYGKKLKEDLEMQYKLGKNRDKIYQVGFPLQKIYSEY